MSDFEMPYFDDGQGNRGFFVDPTVRTVNDITSQCTVDTTKVNEFKAFTIGKLLYISLQVNKNVRDQSTVVSGLPNIYGISSGYGVLSMFFMNGVDANTNATCVIANGSTSARIEFRCGSNLTGDGGMNFSGMFIMR